MVTMELLFVFSLWHDSLMNEQDSEPSGYSPDVVFIKFFLLNYISDS